MKKEEFLNELRSKLNGLSKEEIDERINFYSEMIDDRISEGKSEEEAVSDLGGVDKVIDDILKDTPLLNLVKERIKPKRRLRAWEIVLLILGFPLWFPLLLVCIILCLLGYLLVWLGVVIVYLIEVSLPAGAIYSLVGFIYQATQGQFSLTFFGGMFLCIGLAFLFIFACIGVTKGTIALTKVTARNIKRMFVGKGDK